MAIYKRGREFELGTTEHKSSKWPERDSNPGPPDCESDELTTRPRGLPCLHCAPSTAHNIATFKKAAVLPTSTKRTNKGSFCRAKASIRNNNAGDRLTASWFAIELNEAILLI